MTAKEAIQTIETAKAEVEWNYPLDYAAAFEVAIEALEKQIPKKPDRYYSKFNLKWCKCGNYLGKLKNEQDYCNECGQRLEWGDDE